MLIERRKKANGMADGFDFESRRRTAAAFRRL